MCFTQMLMRAGLAGSVLDARLNRTEAVAWYCTKRADWRVIFLSFREVLSPECLCDELRMFYDRDAQQCAPHSVLWPGHCDA